MLSMVLVKVEDWRALVGRALRPESRFPLILPPILALFLRFGALKFPQWRQDDVG
jgi:hypothetical protein